MALASYHLRIRSANGESRGLLTGDAKSGFLALAMSLHVNEPGALQFRLLADNPIIEDLEIDSQIEVWRDQDKDPLFAALYQGPTYETDDRGQEYFTATCAGQMHLLSRAVIAWPSETADQTIFTDVPAETIMH